MPENKRTLVLQAPNFAVCLVRLDEDGGKPLSKELDQAFLDGYKDWLELSTDEEFAVNDGFANFIISSLLAQGYKVEPVPFTHIAIDYEYDDE